MRGAISCVLGVLLIAACTPSQREQKSESSPSGTSTFRRVSASLRG